MLSFYFFTVKFKFPTLVCFLGEAVWWANKQALIPALPPGMWPGATFLISQTQFPHLKILTYKSGIENKNITLQKEFCKWQVISQDATPPLAPSSTLLPSSVRYQLRQAQLRFGTRAPFGPVLLNEFSSDYLGISYLLTTAPKSRGHLLINPSILSVPGLWGEDYLSGSVLARLWGCRTHLDGQVCSPIDETPPLPCEVAARFQRADGYPPGADWPWVLLSFHVRGAEFNNYLLIGHM